jgi:decaprenylphospho-beta-D-erythro-pentofuranosid-2-ulose 2-reductase
MQKILIIGATSAIAQAIARRLSEGAKAIMLWARSESKLALVAQDLRVRSAAEIQTKAFDFNNLEAHQTALKEVLRIFGSLDLVIICYGSLSNQDACQADFANALEELNTNSISTLSFLTLLSNYFEQQKAGCIVVITSVAGDRGRQSNYVYGTAKAAVNTFLQGLRNRLYRRGVHVVTVKPGFVDTPMTAHLQKNFLFASPETVANDVVRAISGKRSVVYTPWFWRYIMLLINLIPERLFRALKL